MNKKDFFEKSQGFKSYFQEPGIKASQNFIPRVYRLSFRNKAKGQLNGLLQQHIPVRETSAKHGIIDFFPPLIQENYIADQTRIKTGTLTGPLDIKYSLIT